jgi:integrase
MQSDHPHSSVPTPSAVKNCRKCGQSKPVELFPRDRSRRDGRWHTCKQCNGKRLRLLRLAESGCKKRDLYSVRHTFLTRLGESGCDVWTLARIAGHSNISISRRYRSGMSTPRKMRC